MALNQIDQVDSIDPADPARVRTANPGIVASPESAAAGKKSYTPTEAASLGLGWVDSNHPLYGTAGYVGSETAAKGASGAGSGAGTPAPGYGDPASVASGNAVAAQGAAAQTYSATPGAAPTAATTNQGTQDVLRNSLLQRATQGTTIDRNDPTFRGQADAFAAGAERSRRNALDDSAEANFAGGMTSSGGMDVERRAINEAAAQSQGTFEADLAKQELTSRRQEISDALSSMGNLLNADQSRALQKQLADIDAAIKNKSIDSSNSLAQGDLALRDKLGTGGLNLDAARTQLQNQQFNNSLGANMGYQEALLNNQALQALLR